METLDRTFLLNLGKDSSERTMYICYIWLFETRLLNMRVWSITDSQQCVDDAVCESQIVIAWCDRAASWYFASPWIPASPVSLYPNKHLNAALTRIVLNKAMKGEPKQGWEFYHSQILFSLWFITRLTRAIVVAIAFYLEVLWRCFRGALFQLRISKYQVCIRRGARAWTWCTRRSSPQRGSLKSSTESIVNSELWVGFKSASMQPHTIRI